MAMAECEFAAGVAVLRPLSHMRTHLAIIDAGCLMLDAGLRAKGGALARLNLARRWLVPLQRWGAISSLILHPRGRKHMIHWAWLLPPMFQSICQQGVS